jgi:hypothetical protein
VTKEIMEMLARIRGTCQARQIEFEKIGKSPLSDCFGMLYNDSTWPLEVLSYYYNVWSRIPTAGIPKDQIEAAIGENAQRVKETTKWHFVSVISHIEFSAKEYTKVKAAFKSLHASTNRVYMRGILEESTKLKPPLVDKQSLDQWNCILDIRNILIHNNGISDHDSTCNIAKLTVQFKTNTMLKGNLGLFSSLSEATIDLFSDWSKSAMLI